MSSEIFKKAWQTIVLIFFFLFTVYIPLEILYALPYNSFFKTGFWIINIIFIADAFYNSSLFNKGEEKVVLLQPSIKFRSAFLILDIIAAVPFGFLTGNLFFELIRFVKIVRIFKYIRNINLNAIRFSSYLTFFFFLYWFLLAAHWLACGWVSFYDTRVYTADEYVTSLYWCIQTITTVGYGDVTLPDIQHKIYAMIVMLFGVGVYGFIIGNVANILLKRDPARAQFINNLERLRSFVNFREIPQGLQKRIRNYYEYLWKQKIGSNEADFIAGLPDGLKTEVELFLKRDILERIPIFRGINDNFLREVSLHLRPVVYTPGDFIFKKGERGSEMYFLIKGKLNVITGDESKILNTLSDGDFFGELALIKDEIRMASVQAVTYSDVYILNKIVFEHVLNNYPEISSHIKKIAEKRLKNS
jgi:voltage-gated potassium channel